MVPYWLPEQILNYGTLTTDHCNQSHQSTTGNQPTIPSFPLAHQLQSSSPFFFLSLTRTLTSDILLKALVIKLRNRRAQPTTSNQGINIYRLVLSLRGLAGDSQIGIHASTNLPAKTNAFSCIVKFYRKHIYSVSLGGDDC